MRRNTFDKLLSATGFILAAVLLVAGGLLLWASVFVGNQVTTELTSQQILLPARRQRRPFPHRSSPRCSSTLDSS